MPDGVKNLAAYAILREPVIKPLMAGVMRCLGQPPKTVHPLDPQYQNLRVELCKTFEPYLGARCRMKRSLPKRQRVGLK
jgi:hypothetical protein